MRLKAGVVFTLNFILIAGARGQNEALPPASPTPGAPAAATVAEQPAFKPEELEQMLAPIALYPDSLLSQILMASTYPIEVVEAERWLKAHKNLTGDALAAELEKQSWDPSVRSLVNFPDVLTMMSENLSTTVKIGDAFIGQPKEVMDTVQRLRSKAKSTGNLESNAQQSVTVNDSGDSPVIVIESSSPEVIYVPQYNPTVVYGSWPYPAYPPYPYYPPGYVASNVVSFGLGVACGAAWGYAWGNCDWGHGDVDIDINRNTNINNRIDRSKYRGSQTGSFRHDPAHRQGAAYRNQASAQRVGAGATSDRAAQARSQYRGKAEAGRADIARGGVNSARGNVGATRTGQAPSRSPGASPQRAATSSSRGNAFSDASRGGSSARQASTRGASSRSASPSSRAAPSRSSSGMRSGGGGRGGGGRGGGRR